MKIHILKLCCNADWLIEVDLWRLQSRCVECSYEHQVVKFDFTADLTGTGNRSGVVISWLCF